MLYVSRAVKVFSGYLRYSVYKLISVFGPSFSSATVCTKAMLETYYKPPYCSRGEVVAFTGFPLGYIRAAMFMRLAGFPSSRKNER